MQFLIFYMPLPVAALSRA